MWSTWIFNFELACHIKKHREICQINQIELRLGSVEWTDFDYGPRINAKLIIDENRSILSIILRLLSGRRHSGYFQVSTIHWKSGTPRYKWSARSLNLRAVVPTIMDVSEQVGHRTKVGWTLARFCAPLRLIKNFNLPED